ncbi:NUDIX domain-containing protein [Oryzobacter telluris]|uniref:NUDIX domain-containing protein n=1 Tax=Oryzobacter telluris TaxID=3149179 RepID=UPI00370D9709
MSAGVAAAFAHLHADAVAVLRAWDAPDPGQARLREDYLAHLDAHADGVAKAGPPAHLTGSCAVLDPTGTQVLLTHHRKADQWFQFGGHLEQGDPTLWAAARREAREESGLPDLDPLPRPVQLDRHVLVGSFGRCHEHLDVRYAAVAPAGAAAVVSDESHDVRWWPVDALPVGTAAELGPLVSAARGALGL